jgi:hypothetical protein
VTIQEQADHALDSLMLAVRALPQGLRTLHDRREGFGSRKANTIGGSTVRSVTWCEHHQRDLNNDCRSELCVGVPVAAPSDPTGDTAVERAMGHQDPALLEERAIAGIIRRIRKDADDLVTRLASLQEAREAKPHEVRKAEQENERNRLSVYDCCEVCYLSERSDGSRVKEPTHPGIKGSSTVGDRLPAPARLCRRHYEFVTKVGRLPDEDEERQFQMGKAPRVKQEQTARLRAGLQTGSLT